MRVQHPALGARDGYTIAAERPDLAAKLAEADTARAIALRREVRNAEAALAKAVKPTAINRAGRRLLAARQAARSYAGILD